MTPFVGVFRKIYKKTPDATVNPPAKGLSRNIFIGRALKFTRRV
jgi:hypothetical protein